MEGMEQKSSQILMIAAETLKQLAINSKTITQIAKKLFRYGTPQEVSLGDSLNLEYHFDLYRDGINFQSIFLIQIHRPNLNRHNEIDSSGS